MCWRPTEQQIEIAAMWLRVNSGGDGEADACRAVADWIEAEANESILRSEARKGRIPVAALRRRLAQQIK